MPERKKYQHIRITSEHESIDHAFGFLMDILKRPRLGQFVERIEFIRTPDLSDNYPAKDYERELNPEDMGLLRTAVRDAGFVGPKEERVVNMLMQKTPGNYIMDRKGPFVINHPYGIRSAFVVQALACILISVSPNLVFLGMTQPFYHHSELEDTTQTRKQFPVVELLSETNRNPEGKHYLQNLRHVYLINNGNMGFHDNRDFVQGDMIACIGLFNRLPSIESVGIDLLEEDINNGMPGYEHKTSNISRIRINHAATNTTYLLRVMSSCKILREFQYTTGGRGFFDETDFSFNPKALMKGLCEHKETLEILDVDADTHVFYFRADYLELKLANSLEADFDCCLLRDPYYADFEDDDDCDREEREFLTRIWEHRGTLKDFVALKELSMGIGFLLFFADGLGGTVRTKRANSMLVDSLPDSLEYLCIKGYQKGRNTFWDEQVEELVARFESGHTALKELKGVDEMIPNAEVVENADENHHLLWSLEEIGYEDE